MSQFALQLERFAELAGNNANAVVRKISIDILAKVIKRSPVDTGRFRGNWVLSIGEADNTVKNVEDPSGARTVAQESAKLASYQIGPSVFITNSLPYANRLEDGYSNQAPAGMVKVTVSEYQQIVEKAVRDVAQ